MTFRTLMTITAVTLVAVGLGMIQGGPAFAVFYGEPPAADPARASTLAVQVWTGIAFMRLVGALLAGVGLMAWCARGLTHNDAQLALARGLLRLSVLAFLTALAQQLAIWTSPAGWFLVALFFGLAVGSAWWRIQHAKADPFGVVSVRGVS